MMSLRELMNQLGTVFQALLLTAFLYLIFALHYWYWNDLAMFCLEMAKNICGK